MAAENVLIIENELSFRQVLLRTLQKNGYSVFEADTADEGLEFIKKNNPGIVIIDIDKPDVVCSNALETIVAYSPETHVIILSDSNTIKNAVTSKENISLNYLQKPVDENKLLTMLKDSIGRGTLKYSLNNFESFYTKTFNYNVTITSNEKMQTALHTIERAMNSDDALFVYGESGTGKEIIARTIHFQSKRKENPFIVVNCSLFPDKLLDCVLFGHEKGSFNGASMQKIGKLESGQGGTIFLNDFNTLHFSTLRKLIASIQNKNFTRIGGNEPIYTDFRLVLASDSEIKNEQVITDFTENCSLKLRFSTLAIPPLRERKEDIELLVKHYMDSNERYKKKIVDPFVWTLFKKYLWPGNVRELFEVTERVCIISKELIKVEHLPEYFLWPSSERNEQNSEFSVNPTDSDEIIPLETVEKNALIHAIKVTRGNISLAAKKLGIGRATFYRKAKAYHLNDLPLLTQKGREKSRNI